MIKLNNKNITYVALADSANSIKAPKEIWYADSANSVKLVYRRKDALIEGEDYEKYHWLDGDGTAYIDTNINEFGGIMTIHCQSTSNSIDERLLGRELYSTSDSQCLSMFILRLTSNGMLTLWGTEVYHITDVSNPNTIIINLESGVLSCNPSVSQNISVGKNQSGSNIFLFGNSRSSGSRKYGYTGKIASFSLQDGSSSCNYIPCKLLKPVPKWLDANGIRRQVGECGMIDLVSGKFYGNVNSVGTFSVENYYERKEWLVGDGSAYIDTGVTDLSVSDYIKTIFDDSANLDEPMKKRTWGREGRRLLVGNDNYSNRILVWGTDNFIAYYNGGIYIYDMYFDLLNNKVTVNNQIFNLSLPHDNDGISFPLFARHLTSSTFDIINRAKFKSFEIHNQINLIPCTLTMDLPASMDANNIARVKGESGMWDLVSDKFYGNVANSGTFKAVNLAEGVDYEVHDWLGVSVSTRVDMTILPVNSPNLYFKHRHIRGVNYHYFRTMGEGVNYDYYYESDTYRCTVLNLSNSTKVYYTQDITEDEIVINCNSSNRYVNGYDIPIYGSTIKQVSIISRNQNGFEGLISSITVDGIERYIPVKLLRSIPAKYDANGIARQAGECGMYDTVNDLFYGNVASSGTFSVSDDS